MNIGEEIAAEIGILDEFRKSLDAGIAFLLRGGSNYKVRDRSTFAYSDGRPQGRLWDEGLFFSSGTEAMAYWRSEPYTVATVLEALAKYRLGYDKHQRSLFDSPRLGLVAPSNDTSGFSLQVIFGL